MGVFLLGADKKGNGDYDLAFVGLQVVKLIKKGKYMLEVIAILLVMLFTATMIFLNINKEEIWATIKFKEEDEDDN